MSKIRHIKPEFWISEQVMECSPIARLAFIGLWNFCDDGGNHPASVKTIKAEIFPSDDLTCADVQRMIEELVAVGLLEAYTAEGKRYLHVTGFAKHQTVQRPFFKHPQPEHNSSTTQAQPEHIPDIAQAQPEHSSSTDQTQFELSSSIAVNGKVNGKVNQNQKVLHTDSEPTTVYPPTPQIAFPVSEKSALELPEKRSASPPTPAGEVCRAIRDEGIPTANPSHPTLLALIDAGADACEFRLAAREAVAKGKGNFAYVVAMVRKRREEAAALVLHRGRLPEAPMSAAESGRRAAARTIFGKEMEGHGHDGRIIDITPAASGAVGSAAIPRDAGQLRGALPESVAERADDG